MRKYCCVWPGLSRRVRGQGQKQPHQERPHITRYVPTAVRCQALSLEDPMMVQRERPWWERHMMSVPSCGATPLVASPRRAGTSSRKTGVRTPPHKTGRAIYHTLWRVTSDRGATYLLAVAGRIACQEARFFEAFLCPWTSSSTVYTLREIERNVEDQVELRVRILRK